MDSDFKIFPVMLSRQPNFVYFCYYLLLVYFGVFNSYFTFITKEKFNFYLTCSFYYSLVKEGWALKIVMQELVVYKLVAYGKVYMN